MPPVTWPRRVSGSTRYSSMHAMPSWRLDRSSSPLPQVRRSRSRESFRPADRQPPGNVRRSPSSGVLTMGSGAGACRGGQVSRRGLAVASGFVPRLGGQAGGCHGSSGHPVCCRGSDDGRCMAGSLEALRPPVHAARTADRPGHQRPRKSAQRRGRASRRAFPEPPTPVPATASRARSAPPAALSDNALRAEALRSVGRRHTAAAPIPRSCRFSTKPHNATARRPNASPSVATNARARSAAQVARASHNQ